MRKTDKAVGCRPAIHKIKNSITELFTFNPIQDGEGQRGPHTSFSPVTSTNVGIRHPNFLSFSFNPIATLV